MQIGDKALAKMRDARLILALPTSDAAFVYPVWQFVRTDQGVAAVVPFVIEALTQTSLTSWQLAVALTRQHPDLGGLSPIEWCHRHPTALDVVWEYLRERPGF